MTTTTHRPNRRFLYLAIWVAMASVVALGFGRGFLGLLAGTNPPKEWFVHTHAMVMGIWLVLFACQVTLAARGDIVRHRQLGRITISWGLLVLFAGLTVSVMRMWALVDDGQEEAARSAMIWPLIDMLLFAGFFVPAVLYRHRPEIHKRLMVVAATSLIVAGAGRGIRFDAPGTGMYFLFLGAWLSPILIGLLHDVLTRRILHPVYLLGLLVLIVSSFRSSLEGTALWQGLTDLLITLSSGS